ncbi:MAG: PQQ-dependent sugar dehydrogenase [Chitinophagaceae bacterium]
MRYFYARVKKIYRGFYLLPVIIALSMHSIAQPIVAFESVINSTTAPGLLTNPIDIVNAGDNSNRLFIVQQGGVIKVYDQSMAYLGDFLTVTGITSGGEQGLLSMAFHPDYETNGYFFVYYNNAAGDIEVARYHTESGTPNVADPASKKILLTIPHLVQTNHNGGKLNFGNDGYLYFATGDGGGGGDVPNNAQRGDVLLGKMIRIAVSTAATALDYYDIPPDNPFAAVGDGVLDEIYSVGLRNPFRWSFDRLTHDMWIGDVGQGLREEIDFNTAGNTSGLNYGWHCKEGLLDYNGGCAITLGTYSSPKLDYTHDDATGGVAVIGGYVYRGTESPAMYGHYIFADESSGNVWLLPPGGAAADTIQSKNIRTQISSFGEAENGELYATCLNGQVYHVVASLAATLPVKLLDFTAISRTGYNELHWRTSAEIQFKQYEVEFSKDAVKFEQAGIVAAANSGNYEFIHNTSTQKLYYRLKMVDIDGKSVYSKTIIVAAAGARGKNFVTPSIVQNGSISVALDAAYTGLQIITMDGKIVYQASISNRTGRINIQLPSMRSGQYVVRLTGNGKQVAQKIIVQ